MNDTDLIHCVRIFGSYGRGDAGALSDLDILIVTDGLDNLASIESKMSKQILTIYNKKPSYAWYSKLRIKSMFESGHLFAWHLFKESRPIFPTRSDLISELGQPQSYVDAIPDAQSIIDIMMTIKPSIESVTFNTVYESGVLFVCLRNLGLIFSITSKAKFDFSLDSPYHLAEHSLGLVYSDYIILKQNRRASMRGCTSYKIDSNKLLNILNISTSWAEEIFFLLKEGICSDVITDLKVG